MHVQLLPPQAYAEVGALLHLADPTLDVSAEAAKPWSQLWVVRAEATGPVQACVLSWWVADQVEIVQLITQPHLRRKGYARAALSALISAADARAAASLWLEVRGSNHAARALYAAHGFEETRVRPRYYADGEDAVEMMRALAGGVR